MDFEKTYRKTFELFGGAVTEDIKEKIECRK